MEALGQGLASLGNAISTIGIWTGLVALGAIAATTFLISIDKITLQDIKELFSKDRRWR